MNISESNLATRTTSEAETTTSHEVQVLLSRTPRELGWKPSTVRTGLLDSSVQNLLIPGDGKDADTHCIVFPGLRGRKLLQVLKAATANPEEGHFSPNAVEADWSLYELKRRLTPDGGRSLLAQHTEDPVIGETMQQFGRDYVNRWREVTDYGEGGDGEIVLETAFELMIVDMRYFPEQFLMEACNDPEFDINLFVASSRNTIFEDFLTEHPDLERALGKIGKKPNWRVGPDARFEELDDSDREQWFGRYSEWLAKHPDQQSKAVERYFVQYGSNTLLDISESAVYAVHSRHDLEYFEIDCTFSPEAVFIQNKDALVIMGLEPTGDKARPYTIRSTDITVASDKNKRLLSPTVAWRAGVDPQTGEPTREFLTLDEINEKFGACLPGLELDDWLGVVALVGFMPTVQDRTPEKGHLRREGDEIRKKGGQEISVAQIPVYDNLPPVRRQILKDRDGVLASIEALAE